jgi:hypothetical protein
MVDVSDGEMAVAVAYDTVAVPEQPARRTGIIIIEMAVGNELYNFISPP